MTVKDLIEELGKFNGDCEVVMQESGPLGLWLNLVEVQAGEDLDSDTEGLVVLVSAEG